jgi:hypothetical protein
MAGAGVLWATDDPPSKGDKLVIASGSAGAGQIECLPSDVPPRGSGRPNWKRERFCAVALVRYVFRAHHNPFPLVVERVDSPDFVFASCRLGSLKVAVEVTDAGEWEHQRWLERVDSGSPGAGQSEQGKLPGLTPIRPCVHDVPSPAEGWTGDAPRRHFSAALGEAMHRKLAPKVWRNAAHLPRWLVLYDNTNAGWVMLDPEAMECLRAQARVGRDGGISALALVRGLDSVGMVECA